MESASRSLDTSARARAERLLADMSLSEKVGQLVQVNGTHGHVAGWLRNDIQAGRIGSVLNEVDPATTAELQRIAREDSRHGIPLLIGRDVIHGFRTVLPIPLGQAASWNPSLVEEGAALSAVEAHAQGVNWTFAPMLDVCRDPRWGRIAECFGEDPLLTAVFGAASVRGYQDNRDAPIAACAKHFVGYGASESGRDYNTTNIPEVELRNVFLPPFRAALDAGCLSVMPSFSDLNGTPPTGSYGLLQNLLRETWQFEGMVVSDWESITQLGVHGLTENDRDSAQMAARSGVDMDMASNAYLHHLESLVESGELPASRIDQLALNVLAVKFELGLFDEPTRQYVQLPASEDGLALAKQMAIESTVLLRNENHCLPLDRSKLASVAVIGPLADDGHEQMGTWVFDGDDALSVTPLTAIRDLLGNDCGVVYEPGLEISRDRSHGRFDAAAYAAESADAVVLFLGEEAILSGEAHCRTDITLPGAQEALVASVAASGKPIVGVVMAGRPLVLEGIVDKVDALVYAWHGGSMAGPAIADLLFGEATPSGKLPVTLPRAVGQVPIYYAHGNTGKPPTPETVVGIDDIDPKAPQLSIGNTSFHLDVDPSPAFCFGHGLSYTTFSYGEPWLDDDHYGMDSKIAVHVELANTGDRTGTETVQLYTRDLVASITRPVRELKAFQRVTLAPGEKVKVTLEFEAASLSFFDGQQRVVEPGRFRLWVGGSSAADGSAEFVLSGEAPLVLGDS